MKLRERFDEDLELALDTSKISNEDLITSIADTDKLLREMYRRMEIYKLILDYRLKGCSNPEERIKSLFSRKLKECDGEEEVD